ncbi:MAG: bifunctional nuclease family protein [Actinomycetota bacterium]|nr:bifunctional nuclease family protein [Actinomycetota bacterium]
MKPVDVLGVRVEMPTNQPIVLLRERDGERYLPIWIGAAEATAIAYAQQGVEPPRPLTHDLFKDVLETLGHRLTQIKIVELKDKVFYAVLVIDGTHEISARPSDAIALALRTTTEIVVAEDVLDEAGVALTPEEDDEVEKFRDFLENVSAEDFETPDAGDSDPEAGESNR